MGPAHQTEVSMPSASLSDPAGSRFGSGQAVRRIEDQTLITGSGRFADDCQAEGQTHLLFLRAPWAHARLIEVDASAARDMPGVLAVITGADLAAAGVGRMPAPTFQRPDGSPAASAPRHALARDRVRFVGEAVAAVVAETREQAREALEAIMVDVEELPAVVTIDEALAADAPLLSDAPDNICARAVHGHPEAVEAAFAKAAVRVSVDVANQRLAPSPIEPRSTLAEISPDDGRLTLTVSSQMPTAVRDGVAAALGLQPTDLRVRVGDVGGGFGMKAGFYPEDIVLGFAARLLGRPVKWQGERSDDFLAAVHGRDLHSHAELALDADGRVLALRTRSHANVGAYGTPTGIAIQLLIGPWVTTSIYDIPTIHLDITAVLTNTTPTGAYRGAGRPESIFIIERLMDEAARALRLDPSEVRRRNLIHRDQMPYLNAMGQTYDSGDFERILDQGLAQADWSGFEARHAESATRGRLRGRGLASFLEWTGGNAFEEHVSVSIAADGFVEVFSATQAMGQGIATSYAQLVVDALQIPIERVRILQGDTDRGNGFGSAGSRSLFTGGSAVSEGSTRALDKAGELAAEALEVGRADLEYHEGLFRVVGTDHQIGLFELAGRQDERAIRLDSSTTVGGPTWPNACHVAEVEIDPATGTVAIVAYSSVNDVGRVINPVIVRGQLDGGAVQGIGQALSEAVTYESGSGQTLSASFLDYALPHADVLAVDFKTTMDESIPCRTNPLGVKGVGELGTIGATPAVFNAIADALVRAGHGKAVPALQMPLRAEVIWRACATA